MRTASTSVWIGVVLVALLLSVDASWADDAKRGEALFHNCVHCHGEEGGGSPLALAPAIAGFSDWYVEAQIQKFKGQVRGAHPDDLAGLRMLPMSQMLKSEEDVKAVATYIASLPATNPAPTLVGGDASKGKALYATCATCHGASGEGLKALFGPALTNTSDWYLLSSLQKFKSGARGSNPKDQNGALMRSMSNTLVDEQAMKDVVAYIMTLR